LDADAVINNSSQKVGGSDAYPDPAPKKWVGPDPEKHIRSTPLLNPYGGKPQEGILHQKFPIGANYNEP